VERHLDVLREQEWDVHTSWTWMLRIVDVERALLERGYPPLIDTEISFKVRDDLLPGNDATFTLHTTGGKGEVTKNGNAAVEIDVRGLAPLYTGFLPAEALRVAGLVDGPDEALGRLSAIFAGPAPWLADFF
jgi:predicted acetyltransferase